MVILVIIVIIAIVTIIIAITIIAFIIVVIPSSSSTSIYHAHNLKSRFQTYLCYTRFFSDLLIPQREVASAYRSTRGDFEEAGLKKLQIGSSPQTIWVKL